MLGFKDGGLRLRGAAVDVRVLFQEQSRLDPCLRLALIKDYFNVSGFKRQVRVDYRGFVLAGRSKGIKICH